MGVDRSPPKPVLTETFLLARASHSHCRRQGQGCPSRDAAGPCSLPPLHRITHRSPSKQCAIVPMRCSRLLRSVMGKFDPAYRGGRYELPAQREGAQSALYGW